MAAPSYQMSKKQSSKIIIAVYVHKSNYQKVDPDCSALCLRGTQQSSERHVRFKLSSSVSMSLLALMKGFVRVGDHDMTDKDDSPKADTFQVDFYIHHSK